MKRFRFILAAIFFVALICILSKPGRSQDEKPTPAPVNQHWIVEHGEIEALKDRLDTLNARGISIANDDILISADGKRFVIYTSDNDEEEQ